MIKRDVVGLILYDAHKKILLQHRTKDDKLIPDFWALFGGGLENDEEPEKALHREIYEELRYKLKDPRFLFSQTFTYENIRGTWYIFMQKYDEKQELELHEGAAYGWFTIEETEKLKMTELTRTLLKKIKRYMG